LRCWEGPEGDERLVSDIVTLVDSSLGDEKFLFQVYAGVRREETAAWGWSPAQQDVFLRMQFMAQQSSYRAQFPNAAFSLIRRDDIFVGSMIVAREAAAITLVDIALLPEHQRKGTGRRLLEELLEESARTEVPVRLSVRKDNPAIQLYARLGFSIVAADDVYLMMENGTPYK
jgi:ribosomal protein S18 acetylase RimI-like enzyme